MKVLSETMWNAGVKRSRSLWRINLQEMYSSERLNRAAYLAQYKSSVTRAGVPIQSRSLVFSHSDLWFYNRDGDKQEFPCFCFLKSFLAKCSCYSWYWRVLAFRGKSPRRHHRVWQHRQHWVWQLRENIVTPPHALRKAFSLKVGCMLDWPASSDEKKWWVSLLTW